MSEPRPESTDPQLGSIDPLATIKREPTPLGENDSDRTAFQGGSGRRENRAADYQPTYPERIGEYEVLEVLAHGGMGVVFKAEHLRLRRVVALKMILNGQLASADHRERFHTEASATAQLQHPGIVAIFDDGDHEGQPFFAMEFIEGSNLSHKVEDGPLSSQTAASYLEKIARAVHFAHTKSILHRDLKPANVLIDEHDQPKITDFGLAKMLQDDSRQTRTGAIMGTPSYMAPEQALARKQLTTSCDIYSLGAILYELLTGRPPFQGETPLATLSMVIEQEPVPPCLLNPLVDVELETICLKCLEKEPSRRYLSAEALANDLGNYREGRPIQARRLGVLGRAYKWCRRNKSAAALIAVSVAFALAFVWGVLAFGIEQHRLRVERDQEARHARAAEEDAREQAARALEQQQLALDNERVARFMLYVAQFRLARAAWESANLERTSFWLTRLFLHDRRPGAIDPRRWEWHFLWGLCQGKTVMSMPSNCKPTALAFRPGHPQLAVADDNGGVLVWDQAGGKLLRTLKVHDYTVRAIGFSADGKYLATATGERLDSSGEVTVWDADSGLQVHALTKHPRVVHALAYSRDGRHLATACDDGIVRIWDAKYGQLVRTCAGHQGPARALTFNAEGSRLASAAELGSAGEVKIWPVADDKDAVTLALERPVTALAFREGQMVTASADHKLRVWDVEKARELLAFPMSGVSTAVFSLDGTILATCNPDFLVTIWDTLTGKERFRSRWYMQTVRRLGFSPDGRRLACAAEDGTLWLGHTYGGQEALGLEGHTHAVRGISFSPDGTRLASVAEDGLRLWNPGDGAPQPTVQGLNGITAIAYNPSGDGLALAGRDKTVRLFNSAATHERAVLSGHLDVVHALAFSADGTLLASGGDDHRILLWNAQTGRLLNSFQAPAGDVVALAFSPKDKTLASACNGEDVIHLWDLEKKRIRKILSGHANGVVALAFSPNGERLASGSYDKTIRFWDPHNGQDLFTLEGHSKVVNSIAFNGDGTRLVSGGGDHTVRIWDMLTRQELLKLDGGPREVTCVAFSPGDGLRVVAAGRDHLIRIWNALR